MAKFTKLSFCPILFSGINFLHANVLYVYMCKVSDCFSKSFGTSSYRCKCIIYSQAIQNGYVINSQLPKIICGMNSLLENAQYICIAHAKYQITAVETLVHVDFPVYTLITSKPLFESKQWKWRKFTKLSFCQFCYHIKLLNANVHNRHFWFISDSDSDSDTDFYLGLLARGNLSFIHY